MNTKTRIAAILFLTSFLSPLVPSAHAGPGHDHDHAQMGAADVAIPETRAALWEAIQTEHAALAQAIREQNGEAAHTAQAKLHAYLKALPGKLDGLDESAARRIEGQARNLARAYEAVHHAADDKAWDKAAAEMNKASLGLKIMAVHVDK